MIKLNIGCADHLYEGWINMDLVGRANVIEHDARNPFLYEDNTVDFIYNEHFIEHLSVDEGVNFFKEAYRILKPGGVIRTSTFDIDNFIVECHPGNENWEEYKDSICGGHFKSKKTRIDFLSTVIYEGGAHKHILNPEELIRMLTLVGFSKFNAPEKLKSAYAELENMEYRSNSDCIIEAIK